MLAPTVPSERDIVAAFVNLLGVEELWLDKSPPEIVILPRVFAILLVVALPACIVKVALVLLLIKVPTSRVLALLFKVIDPPLFIVPTPVNDPIIAEVPVVAFIVVVVPAAVVKLLATPVIAFSITKKPLF